MVLKAIDIAGGLASLRLAILLLAGQLALLLAGAFIMPAKEEFGSINSVNLFRWIGEAPPGATWWIWASLGVLFMLAINTVFCGADSITGKRRGRPWLSVIPPQLIHLGFIFMLLAHLVSSQWAGKGSVAAAEGMAVALPGGALMKVISVDIDLMENGFPRDWSASLLLKGAGGEVSERVIGPNRPAFFEGLGIYIKDVRIEPVRATFLEVHREPGAPWALAGGVFFTLGVIMLVWQKITREK